MKIEFIENILYIYGVKISKNTTVNDIDSISEANWEVWDYGALIGRRKIFNYKGEKIILILNFDSETGCIYTWQISPYELINNKIKHKKWVARILNNLKIPCRIKKEGFQIFNQYDHHNDYYYVVGYFDIRKLDFH